MCVCTPLQDLLKAKGNPTLAVPVISSLLKAVRCVLSSLFTVIAHMCCYDCSSGDCSDPSHKISCVTFLRTFWTRCCTLFLCHTLPDPNAGLKRVCRSCWSWFLLATGNISHTSLLPCVRLYGSLRSNLRGAICLQTVSFHLLCYCSLYHVWEVLLTGPRWLE